MPIGTPKQCLIQNINTKFNTYEDLTKLTFKQLHPYTVEVLNRVIVETEHVLMPIGTPKQTLIQNINTNVKRHSDLTKPTIKQCNSYTLTQRNVELLNRVIV